MLGQDAAATDAWSDDEDDEDEMAAMGATEGVNVAGERPLCRETQSSGC